MMSYSIPQQPGSVLAFRPYYAEFAVMLICDIMCVSNTMPINLYLILLCFSINKCLWLFLDLFHFCLYAYFPSFITVFLIAETSWAFIPCEALN